MVSLERLANFCVSAFFPSLCLPCSTKLWPQKGHFLTLWSCLKFSDFTKTTISYLGLKIEKKTGEDDLLSTKGYALFFILNYCGLRKTFFCYFYRFCESVQIFSKTTLPNLSLKYQRKKEIWEYSRSKRLRPNFGKKDGKFRKVLIFFLESFFSRQLLCVI